MIILLELLNVICVSKHFTIVYNDYIQHNKYLLNNKSGIFACFINKVCYYISLLTGMPYCVYAD